MANQKLVIWQKEKQVNIIVLALVVFGSILLVYSSVGSFVIDTIFSGPCSNGICYPLALSINVSFPLGLVLIVVGVVLKLVTTIYISKSKK